jgi:hypothetical protein
MSRTPSKSSKSAHVGAVGDTRRAYEFAEGVRGKFFRQDAVHIQPVHLEADVLAYLQARATARGVSLSRIVNDQLKKDIELIETLQG